MWFRLRPSARFVSRFINSAMVAAVIVIAFLVLTSPPSQTSQLTGSPRIVDGDTLAFGELTVRLTGIDAPEFNQVCKQTSGQFWPCGQSATEHLEQLVNVGEWTCQQFGLDKYRRTLAQCWVNTQRQNRLDVAASLVASGLALSVGQYAEQQKLAQASSQGMFSGEYITPAAWRDGERFVSSADRPKGFLQRLWEDIVNWF